MADGISSNYLMSKNLPKGASFSTNVHVYLPVYENRVRKHFVISLNFPFLTLLILCCLLMTFFFGGSGVKGRGGGGGGVVLWLGICIEVAGDRISRISI